MPKTKRASRAKLKSYRRDDLEAALRALSSLLSKCEKVRPRLTRGTAQHSLLVNRIAALRIAVTLTTRALESAGPIPS